MSRLPASAVLVTGAATGIGAAIARACVAAGAGVIAVDRDPAVHALAEEIGGVALLGDVREAELADAAVAAGRERYGSVCGLVNNAAMLTEADVLETDDDLWEQTLAVNLTAPFRWSRSAISAMLEDGGGAIVNIVSIEATHVRARHAAYVAAKGGLLTLTKAIAIEYGRRGVRANAISPGSIDTEMFRNYVAGDEELSSRLIAMNYVGRLGRSDEIAAACVHLLGSESGFTNGAELVIDGGRIAAT